MDVPWSFDVDRNGFEDMVALDVLCMDCKYMWANFAPLITSSNPPKNVEITSGKYVQIAEIERQDLFWKCKGSDQGDCHSCRLLLNSTDLRDNFPPTKRWYADHSDRIFVRLYYGKFSPEREFKVLVSLRTLHGNYKNQRQRHKLVVHTTQHEGEVHKAEMRRRVPTRPSNLCTGSEQTIARIQNWRQECGSQHDHCHSAVDSESSRRQPARLLLVQDALRTGHVKIVETEPNCEVHEYFTLSHCWGGALRCRLFKENFDTYMQVGISVSTLPRTFRDAIWLTVKLGAKYLWIDALCIIQNSLDDWKKEASNMSDIYANANLNIAATASKDSEGGLFRSRDVLSMTKCKIQTTPDSADVLCMQRRGKYQSLDARISRAPLNQRAWVIQERWLSPRTVHFANEIYWECRSVASSETTPDWDLKSSPQARFLKPDDYYGPLYGWINLLQFYSSTFLTFESDRLVALSGLAKNFQALNSDRVSLGRYLAGLWEHDLIAQLSWQCEITWRTASSCEKSYAPSWSWASRRDGVLFAAFSDIDEFDATKRDSVVRVIKLETTPVAGFDEFGASRISASTTIGLRRPSPLWIETKSVHNAPEWEEILGEKYITWDSLAGSFGTEEFEEVYALFPLWKHLGLVLKPTPCRSGQFVRVGLVKIEQGPEVGDIRYDIAKAMDPQTLPSSWYRTVAEDGMFEIEIV